MSSPPRHLIDHLLAAIPRYPGWEPLPYEHWAEALPLISATHSPHADLGCAAQFIWFGQHHRRWSRIGSVVLIGHPRTREVMAVQIGTAKIRQERTWASLLRDHELRYVPGETAMALREVAERSGHPLFAEADDTDHVYDLERLARLDDPRLRHHAEAAGQLARRGVPIVREGRLRDPWVRDHLSVVFDRWTCSRPGGTRAPEDVLIERAGLFGLPADSRTDHLRVYTLWAHDRPAAFSLVEPAWAGMWLGVVFKYDRAVRGATAYLRRAVAQRAFGEQGPGTLNLAQDAGVAGLRTSKAGWQPVGRVEKWRSQAVRDPRAGWGAGGGQSDASLAPTPSAAASSWTSAPALG